MNSAVCILDLPSEVLALILYKLNLESLIYSKHVCRRFWNTFKNSALLQYRIELEEACLQDDSSDYESTSVRSRLEKLRAHCRAWSTLSWSEPEVIDDCSDAVCWALVSNVFCIGRPGAVVCRNIGPSIPSMGRRTWTIEHWMREYDLTIDPMQDLLVVMGNSDDGSSVQIIFLELSSGVPHPAANGIISVHETSIGLAERRYMVQIDGSRLGILLEGIDATTFFNVWEWTSGHLECDLELSFLQSFSFLPGDLVLFAIAPGKAEVTQLIVCDLSTDTYLGRKIVLNTSDDIGHLPHICKFRFYENEEDKTMLVRVHPTLLPSQCPVPPSTGDYPSFWPKAKAQVLSITLLLESARSRYEVPVIILIPLFEIMRHIDRARSTSLLPLDIRWDEWGSSSAHKESVGRYFYSESTHGTRFAYLYRLAVGMKVNPRDFIKRREFVSIIDFNPHAPRCTDTSGPQEELKGKWSSTPHRPGTTEAPQGFKGSIRWEKVLLGSDSMVAIYDGREDGIETVFAIVTLQDPAATESDTMSDKYTQGLED
ncbi:hypothetical protein CONPUDRAFT_144353 [Coniophora puteana RWD-64-598 SS2]|uniref:F-box domain-containing protein n=1 Tax=Coniophora puteana (strain RWD-64-598) TaxID=741705 RepID=A0A5M3MNG2_CONPW|nr:uncharacterized protein CONPUDRAFT_144353 [Coniophora puteana RWD-64-598 SS2]EIW80161.1 hypothetical protein CONPUDRAFT_144353 [Coniophora puteana RWD-64-598 SS2]